MPVVAQSSPRRVHSRSDCGDRYDIVVWGYSAADICFQEHRYWGDRFSTEPQLHWSLTQGFALYKDGNCAHDLVYALCVSP